MSKVRQVKQVIVVRKDIKMPQGKLAAQVAHASLAALLNQGTFDEDDRTFTAELDDASWKWCNGDFTKVVVYVRSEEALKEIYGRAKDMGLACSLIKDAGYTVFSEPTYTTCAVGPALIEDVNDITGGLPLV